MAANGAVNGSTEGLTRNELICYYFRMGFSADEILAFLRDVHGIVISLRQLKRLLSQLNLRRRSDYSDLQEVAQTIEQELTGSGSLIGYRAMHQRLITRHGLVVRREDVRKLLRALDPEGVDLRSRHRLRRRTYRAKGPNYIWHVDGYDKLKPFGFCIHGCIDGYSRRVLWLEVACSNNDPKIVGRYFLDYVKELGGTARIIRGDRGTENGGIETMQHFFRENDADAFAGSKSFMYGRSTSNQRIEAWWGTLRRSSSEWWIRHFKEMRDIGLFQDDNPIHRECLRFAYMDVLRNELSNVAALWNTHRVRPSRNSESPSGRPDVNYFLPSFQSGDTIDYVVPVSQEYIDSVEDMEICKNRTDLLRSCSGEFRELAEMIMEEEDFLIPHTANEAKAFYVDLLNHIEQI